MSNYVICGIYCYISIYEGYHIVMDGLVSGEEQMDSCFKTNESTIYLHDDYYDLS
jgi:hypothetical protein